jgi:hypothetical protein
MPQMGALLQDGLADGTVGRNITLTLSPYLHFLDVRIW